MQRMAPEVIIAILAGVICVVMAGLSLWRRRLGVQSEPACIEPRSLVRVIESRRNSRTRYDGLPPLSAAWPSCWSGAQIASKRDSSPGSHPGHANLPRRAGERDHKRATSLRLGPGSRARSARQPWTGAGHKAPRWRSRAGRKHSAITMAVCPSTRSRYEREKRYSSGGGSPSKPGGRSGSGAGRRERVNPIPLMARARPIGSALFSRSRQKPAGRRLGASRLSPYKYGSPDVLPRSTADRASRGRPASSSRGLGVPASVITWRRSRASSGSPVSRSRNSVTVVPVCSRASSNRNRVVTATIESDRTPWGSVACAWAGPDLASGRHRGSRTMSSSSRQELGQADREPPVLLSMISHSTVTLL